MNTEFYVITRGVKAGRNLTTAQRSSSKFSEEPVVLGKVLRSRSLPMKVSPEQFNLNRIELERLEKAGAIDIYAPFKSDVDDSLNPEKQMGSSSLIHGGTPTVHPSEAVIDPVPAAPVIPVEPVAPAVVPVVETPADPQETPTPVTETPVETPVEVPAVVETKVEEKQGKKGKK